MTTKGDSSNDAGKGEDALPTTASSKTSNLTLAKRQQSTDAKLRFISQTHRRELGVRRGYEWKTLVATLTFFVLATAASLKEVVNRPQSCTESAFVFVFAAVVASISITYLHHLHGANQKNKQIAHAAEDKLINSVGDNNLMQKRDDALKGDRGNWAWQWEATLIVAFAFASALLIVGRSW